MREWFRQQSVGTRVALIFLAYAIPLIVAKNLLVAAVSYYAAQ